MFPFFERPIPKGEYFHIFLLDKAESAYIILTFVEIKYMIKVMIAISIGLGRRSSEKFGAINASKK
jgi:hypothetical protein